MADLSALKSHAARLESASLSELVAQGGSRDAALQFEAAGVSLDARKQRLDEAALGAFHALLEAADFEAKREALYAGDIVNTTEKRPAIHAAIRNPDLLTDKEFGEEVRMARVSTRAFAATMKQMPILDGHPVKRVVNIGIGGSDLGPRFLYDALHKFGRKDVELKFVSNLDPADLEDAIEGADPLTTLFCVISKSFTTQETLMNARAAHAWLNSHLGKAGADARFAAATAAPQKAIAFGLDPSKVFAFAEGVGGRYSVWSAAGLCLDLVLGPDIMDRLLDGARAMDEHFASAPLAQNMPVAKAIIDVWNRAMLGQNSRCVGAYASRLQMLPNYLQQLEMESLGKSVTHAGESLGEHQGGQIVWGGRGSDVQHSFFQWLHQSTDRVPVDFIGLRSMTFSDDERAKALIANMVAQSAALMQGREGDDEQGQHRHMPGGRASSIVMLDELSPETVGALVALHEHKVFTEAVLYDLNPFDQWGVELGKELANSILSGDQSRFDPVTQDLLRQFNF